MTALWLVLTGLGTVAEFVTRRWTPTGPVWSPPQQPDPTPTALPVPHRSADSLAAFLHTLYDLPAADREDRRAA